MTRVLPEPAPARISSGPSVWRTASCCSGFRSATKERSSCRGSGVRGAGPGASRRRARHHVLGSSKTTTGTSLSRDVPVATSRESAPAQALAGEPLFRPTSCRRALFAEVGDHPAAVDRGLGGRAVLQFHPGEDARASSSRRPARRATSPRRRTCTSLVMISPSYWVTSTWLRASYALVCAMGMSSPAALRASESLPAQTLVSSRHFVHAAWISASLPLRDGLAGFGLQHALNRVAVGVLVFLLLLVEFLFALLDFRLGCGEFLELERLSLLLADLGDREVLDDAFLPRARTRRWRSCSASGCRACATPGSTSGAVPAPASCRTKRAGASPRRAMQ